MSSPAKDNRNDGPTSESLRNTAAPASSNEKVVLGIEFCDDILKSIDSLTQGTQTFEQDLENYVKESNEKRKKYKEGWKTLVAEG